MAFDPRRLPARQEGFSRTGVKNKPDSVPGPHGPGDGHSSTGGITPAGDGGSLRLPAAYPEAGGGPPHALPYLALLLAGFTKLLQSPGALVRSYRTFSPLPGPAPGLRPAPECGPGGIFSVALSFALPRLGITQRNALWSPDFPPPSCEGGDRPFYSGRSAK